MATVPTPRDLPGLRHDLADWYATEPAARHFADLIPTTLAEGRAVAARHRATTRAAGLYYVNDDMTDLAVAIGRGLEKFAVLADADLPEDHGLLMWAHRPVDIDDPELRGAPLAVTWTAVGGHVQVTLYEHLPTADPEAREVYTAILRQHDPRGLVPELVQMWETTMPADGRERPWAVVEDAENSHKVLRTLLATWLLIRQPSDARKALHEVEEVAAPKSVQKRIARGAGDPTRTVRYVTLRKSLRPGTGEGSGGREHAQKVYRHRWFVRPHRARQFYPSKGEHQTIWRGPYLVVPAGCEDAPILGGERVNVLRR